MASGGMIWNFGTATCVFLAVVLSIGTQTVEGTAIRGVSISKLSLYSPEQDFTCLDGSKTMAFASVNDDYCDCVDGSDEPGTSACRNGHFHCTNAGHRPLNIPSSRVNDMICDCCDGTDEYDGGASCENVCKELGKEERERIAKERAEAQEGVRIKQEYSKQGKDVKVEKQTKLSALQETLTAHKAELESLRVEKEAAEEPERVAKEKHQKMSEEMKAFRQQQNDKLEGIAAFTLLDANKDGYLNFKEMESNPFLSKDLTQEEWTEYFGAKVQLHISGMSEYWTHLKPLYVPDGRKDELPKGDTEEQPAGESVDASEGEAPLRPPELPSAEDIPGVDDTGEDDDDDGATEEGASDTVPPAASEDEVPFDDATKQLIAVADEARGKFNEAQKKHDDTDKEIKDIEKVLAYDFGEHEEFFPLHGQCFEYQDREYTYKMCPYDKASQEPKNGGAITSLGEWDNWIGPSDKYSMMNFKDGQSCWNGPNRSAKVQLICGTENKVISVDEPNRCEYVMQFTTPSRCHEHMHHVTHEEL